MPGHAMLYRQLIWFGIAAPLFAGACALLAKEWKKREWVWFLLGFFFNLNAVLILVFLEWYKKPSDTGKSTPSH